MTRCRSAALLAAVVGTLALSGCGSADRASAACSTTIAGAETVRLDVEQAAHATTIAAVGRRLGLADHAVTVALATAMQESGLRNLSYGDRDSVGLFQQRPSQGWGTVEQIRTPASSAAAFYRGLAQVEGWNGLPVTVAAQAVQRSAYPDAYAAHEDDARSLARAMTGQVPAAFSCRRLPAGNGLQGEQLRRAAATELGPDGLDATRGGDLWAAASWLVGHAERYGITSVTAGGQRWTASSGSWSADPAAGPGLAYA